MRLQKVASKIVGRVATPSVCQKVKESLDHWGNNTLIAYACEFSPRERLHKAMAIFQDSGGKDFLFQGGYYDKNGEYVEPKSHGGMEGYSDSWEGVLSQIGRFLTPTMRNTLFEQVFEEMQSQWAEQNHGFDWRPSETIPEDFYTS